MYRFVLWLVPTVEKFPRRQKFLLGDRLQATALDVLERLVEATCTRDRRRHLVAASGGGESRDREAAVPVPAGQGLGHLDERRSSRFNDRHFQSSINGLKCLLESVHSGSVVNIEDTVNLWHVPTKPPPKFSLGDSLLSHRVIQFNLWYG